ncbi:MAG: DUF4139 domain-containing protein [Phycisphaerae bacterium]|nr:DUF4139 domain-containing protein [Phycisphaerae bacterium]
MRPTLGIATAWLIFTTMALVPLAAAKADPAAEVTEGVGLTVYNQDFAIIRERRMLTLDAGRSDVRFKDVAATIVPESVQFRCLRPADGATVIEQNYEFDLVSAGRLLDKYIDKPIGVISRTGDLFEGRLLSFDDGQLVLAGEKGIELIPRGNNVKDIRFSSLPGGLLTKPTLVWLVEAKAAGEHLTEVAYRANQVNWRVDYRAVADAAGNVLDLSGWVTIDNRSGATYRDARLKLMAGDVHIVEPEAARGRVIGSNLEARSAPAKMAFQEKAFAEYHLYELPRPTTIRDRQIKQIELLDVAAIPVRRIYEYRGEGDNVRVVLEFKNAKETHEALGIPLPKGPIRVYQRDADGQAEFIGQDEIDHTPKNELVKVWIGNAFDIKAERVQTDNQRPSARVNVQAWQIRLRNHKAEPVHVQIIETLERANWKILEADREYAQKDYRTITFDVDIPADGESWVKYTVRYWW